MLHQQATAMQAHLYLVSIEQQRHAPHLTGKQGALGAYRIILLPVRYQAHVKV